MDIDVKDVLMNGYQESKLLLSRPFALTANPRIGILPEKTRRLNNA